MCLCEFYKMFLKLMRYLVKIHGHRKQNAPSESIFTPSCDIYIKSINSLLVEFKQLESFGECTAEDHENSLFQKRMNLSMEIPNLGISMDKIIVHPNLMMYEINSRNQKQVFRFSFTRLNVLSIGTQVVSTLTKKHI